MNTVEGSDAAPSPGASETANAEGKEGAAGMRKRPRLSAAFSRFVEDESLGLGFRRTEFRAMPTEDLDEFAGLWPHPYLPPGKMIGDDVGRELRQTTHYEAENTITEIEFSAPQYSVHRSG